MDGRVEYRHYDADSSLAVNGLSEFLGADFQGRSFMFDCVVLNVCMKGSAKLKINDKEIPVLERGIFFILPKHVYSIGECSGDLDIKVVPIPHDAICRFAVLPDFDLLRSIDVCPLAKLDMRRWNSVRNLCAEIVAWGGDGLISAQIRRTLTASLVLVALSAFGGITLPKRDTGTRKESLTRSFFDLLQQYYVTERSVAFYAGKLCVTPKYLATVVKAITGHSAQDWINELVIIEAKRYVMTTGQTVQQISESLHFSTASSFVRFFRTHTGCTPLEYRRRNLL